VGLFISAGTENQLTAGLVSFFALMLIWILDPVAQSVPTDTRTGLISAIVLLAALALFLFLNTKNWVIVLGVVIIGGLAIGILYLVTVGGMYVFRDRVYFGFIQNFLGWFSLNRRYQPFSMGLLRVDALVYYTSFTALFLFLTIRLIEKRRWN
jgi:ABC-2 type transport system permease protein